MILPSAAAIRWTTPPRDTYFIIVPFCPMLSYATKTVTYHMQCSLTAEEWYR